MSKYDIFLRISAACNLVVAGFHLLTGDIQWATFSVCTAIVCYVVSQ